MGYETQLIVGVDTGQSYSDAGTYFQVYATIDMCKLGHQSAVHDLDSVNKTPDEKSWYFYAPAGDGDTPVTKDRYGAMFKPIPIADVIAALEKDAETTDYRRVLWAITMLKAMDKVERLSVILWGY